VPNELDLVLDDYHLVDGHDELPGLVVGHGREAAWASRTWDRPPRSPSGSTPAPWASPATTSASDGLPSSLHDRRSKLRAAGSAVNARARSAIWCPWRASEPPTPRPARGADPAGSGAVRHTDRPINLSPRRR
jgi:hypothetical protein